MSSNYRLKQSACGEPPAPVPRRGFARKSLRNGSPVSFLNRSGDGCRKNLDPAAAVCHHPLTQYLLEIVDWQAQSGSVLFERFPAETALRQPTTRREYET
ncbi:MAG: hypothetical protein LBP61_05080 [Desulfovibrio sp.]|jgi:hypothetical protein|nr:hypothetical protein [Desulfovibrio sp.]